jgi:HD-GYP domain
MATLTDIRTHHERFTAYYHLFSSRFSHKSDDYEHLHLKWLHSLNVAANADQIILSVELPEHLVRAAQLAALYHDVGRFEQYVQFGTFRDADSANHGAWGAKILGNSDLLDGEDEYIVSLVRAAVNMHNRAELPSGIPEDDLLVTSIVRDADKIDILRVLSAYMHPAGPRSDVVTAFLPDLPDRWSAKIYTDLMEGRSAKYGDMRFLNDFRLLLCTWLFGLKFPVSRTIIAEQGHVPEILEGLPDTPEMEQVRQVVTQALRAAYQ